MERAVLFIIAGSVLCAVSSNVARQYHFVYDWKNWTDARRYCREKYTDLATIQDMDDVKTLNSMANLTKMVYAKYYHLAWIGLYDDVKSWRWSMSDRDFYNNVETEFRNWLSGNPNNAGGKEHCAAMSDKGQWDDQSCNTTLQVVCSDVRGLNVTFVLINDTMNWTEAQSYCRANHRDLASVRNMLENQKVQQLVPAGQTVWIGLFRDTWKWTDGTNSPFQYWNVETNRPSNNFGNNTCVAGYFGNLGKWEDWNCDQKFAFVCYIGPANKQVVKLRLETKYKTLALNSTAVKEEMLKQLKQKLEDRDVKGDLKLSWRKQPDGEVFHKDEKETKKDTSCKSDDV